MLVPSGGSETSLPTYNTHQELTCLDTWEFIEYAAIDT